MPVGSEELRLLPNLRDTSTLVPAGSSSSRGLRSLLPKCLCQRTALWQTRLQTCCWTSTLLAPFQTTTIAPLRPISLCQRNNQPSTTTTCSVNRRLMPSIHLEDRCRLPTPTEVVHHNLMRPIPLADKWPCPTHTVLLRQLRMTHPTHSEDMCPWQTHTVLLRQLRMTHPTHL